MGRARRRPILAAILVVLVGACAAPSAATPSASAATPTAAPSEVVWTRIDAGTYSIEFPGTPQDLEQGGARLLQLGASDDPVVYQAAAVELEPELVAQRGIEGSFDRFQGGMLEGTTQEVLSQNSVRLDGVPGRRLVIRHRRGAVEVRLYLKGSRLFFLQTIVAPGLRSNTDRFFDSFRISD